MAFEELKRNAEAIHENVKGYIETSLAYYKLWGMKVMVKSMVFMAKFFLLVICLVLFLLFVSIAAALALGQYLGNCPLGFLCVAGIYFVLFIILFLIKDKILKASFLEIFSDIFFKD